MHAGIGAARAGDFDLTCKERGEGALEFAGNRAQFGLKLEAGKSRAVVLDDGSNGR